MIKGHRWVGEAETHVYSCNNVAMSGIGLVYGLSYSSRGTSG